MRNLLIYAVLTACAACAGAPAAPSGPGGDAAPSDPARLYRAKCSACHRPYERGSRSLAAWEAVLARMAPKAHLSPWERDVLRGWLEAGASDAPAGGGER